jgi:hypothetical protein
MSPADRAFLVSLRDDLDRIIRAGVVTPALAAIRPPSPQKEVEP